MNLTTDTLTGRPFRWNSTTLAKADDGSHVNVPARMTSRTAVHLHPSRVPAPLLAELNPESTIMTKFKVFLQRYVEQTAVVEIEADTVEDAVAEGEERALDDSLQWSAGDDIIAGAAAEVGSAVYQVYDEAGDEIQFER